MENNLGELSASVCYISKSIVQSYSYNKGSRATKNQRTIHLTPWDLQHLSLEYIQSGVLFPKPSIPLNVITSHLITSLSQTLDHFYPLAGRLTTINHNTEPPSISIYIDCNNQGAEFIVASVKNLAISDIVTPLHVPPITKFFFPLNGATSHDGHSLPLLAIQVTELADGVFIGCSLNHSVGDVTSFWHFLNSWSEISRLGHITRPPILNRWFLDPSSIPICLPFRNHEEFIKKSIPPRDIKACFFKFSVDTIGKLKAKANLEMKTERISSLQALLAHVWRSIVRARKHRPNQETCYILIGGNRSRIESPLSESYFGNCVYGLDTKALAGEVMNQSLGWVAWQLKRTVASLTNDDIRNWLCSWPKDPAIVHFADWESNKLVTINSPRFNVYGNDFGWGRPITARSGNANKVDGTVVVYPGHEAGSMTLEICMSAQALQTLLEDDVFMETTSK